MAFAGSSSLNIQMTRAVPNPANLLCNRSINSVGPSFSPHHRSLSNTDNIVPLIPRSSRQAIEEASGPGKPTRSYNRYYSPALEEVEEFLTPYWDSQDEYCFPYVPSFEVSATSGRPYYPPVEPIGEVEEEFLTPYWESQDESRFSYDPSFEVSATSGRPYYPPVEPIVESRYESAQSSFSIGGVPLVEAAAQVEAEAAALLEASFGENLEECLLRRARIALPQEVEEGLGEAIGENRDESVVIDVPPAEETAAQDEEEGVEVAGLGVFGKNTLIAGVVFALAQIKSQGKAGSLFETHPKTMKACVIGLSIYALASVAEYILSGLWRPARVGTYIRFVGFAKMICLVNLVVALASLFLF